MIMLIFICPEPRGPTELLENAKNRFQIGLAFPGKWHKNQNLVCIAKTSCLFEMHFMYSWTNILGGSGGCRVYDSVRLLAAHIHVLDLCFDFELFRPDLHRALGGFLSGDRLSLWRVWAICYPDVMSMMMMMILFFFWLFSMISSRLLLPSLDSKTIVDYSESV